MRRTPQADRIARLALESDNLRRELLAIHDRLRHLQEELVRTRIALQDTLSRNDTLWRTVLRVQAKRTAG